MFMCMWYIMSVVHNIIVLYVSDGELYTGTVADFRGTRPVISRHLSEGSHVDLKLDDTLGWLEGKITLFLMLPQKQREGEILLISLYNYTAFFFTTQFQILLSSAPRMLPVRRRFISSLVRLEKSTTSLRSLQCLALPKFAQ